ncbi:hypothetical protein BA899_09655 [Spiribacter sp. SSL99]|uniref:hypothetical protein n=1 Tax=Spiribacter sp. SSL99 TaxID=1866884 RepID=UPI00190FB24D|nr:hypothetical protein [Spiribacter sp. SSL99]KAF0286409.1 hypothetical protein BA899_09655 [Spiribacter sp. SSL99]
MGDLSWVMSSGFLGLRFYDLPNFFLCVLFVIIGSRRFNIEPAVQVVLLLHCLLPFFLNEFLFPTEYLGDQFRYWRQFNAIRAGELPLIEALVAGGNVEQAAALFAMIPLPMALSPISLGFFNTLIWVVLFFWLHQKGVFTKFSMWFFLLYPSMALYTGLSLRDTFILVFMVMAVQFAREGRWLPMLAVFAPLYAIKFQNFLILAPVLVIYLLFGIRHHGVTLFRGVLTALAGLAALIILSPAVLPVVNYFRAALYAEDGGDRDELNLIDGPTEFVVEGLTSGVYFLLKPFPWEASNALQIVQSAENLVIFGLLVLLVRAAWRRVPKKLVFWMLFIGFSLSVYGLVVFNYGTSARYRYPFLVIFILFTCADCYVQSLFKRILPDRWYERSRVNTASHSVN